MKKLISFALLSLLVCFSASAQVTVVPLGTSGNVFGVAYGSYTNLWYNNDINTIAFVHRSKIGGPNTTTGNILYDVSKNGGMTWSVDQGPAYKDSSGRYPHGVIYNLSGKTNPDSAYISCYGQTNSSGHFKGTTRIGTTTQIQGTYPFANGLHASRPAGFQVVKNTGTIWASSPGVLPSQTGYDDTIVLSKGTFSAGDVNYVFSRFYAPLYMYANHTMAWNDAGDIGYVAIIGNDQNPLIDSTLYLIVYKTTDGGITWNKVANKININIDLLDPVLANAGYKYTTGYDLDCAVDNNNNLHIAVAVGASPGNFVIASIHGYWGIFDIYTIDGGYTWCFELAGKPQTFRGTFGDGSTANPTVGEDSRPQATRSWDGSKIFISWFDTDTLTFATGQNIYPDMFCHGFNVSTNQWTTTINFTQGTNAQSFCTFGNVSYYSIGKPNGDECIPMVYTTLTSTFDTGSPVSFSYLDGACISSSQFNQPSNGLCGLVHIAENSMADILSLSPNPVADFFVIKLSSRLKDATLHIYDATGRIVKTEEHITKNETAVSCKDLSPGIYFVRIGDENYRWAGKFVKVSH